MNTMPQQNILHQYSSQDVSSLHKLNCKIPLNYCECICARSIQSHYTCIWTKGTCGNL